MSHFGLDHSVSPVQSLSHVRLFATPWITARQASLSITNSRSLLKLISLGATKRRSPDFASFPPNSLSSYPRHQIFSVEGVVFFSCGVFTVQWFCSWAYCGSFTLAWICLYSLDFLFVVVQSFSCIWLFCCSGRSVWYPMDCSTPDFTVLPHLWKVSLLFADWIYCYSEKQWLQWRRSLRTQRAPSLSSGSIAGLSAWNLGLSPSSDSSLSL